MSAKTEYENNILQWRSQKYESLVRENGWLALAGLFWLNEGRNLIGSNPMCEVILPERAPTFFGVVEVKGKAVSSQPSPEAEAVPWLLLEAVPNSGSGNLADVDYIRRTDTHGGAAPKEACTSGEIRQPYTATYSFYSK